jgi:hypothetical protein
VSIRIDSKKGAAMDDNTALLWSLLAESAEWAMKQGQDAPDGAARIATDARQHSTPLTAVLARNLVHALTSEGCRGLIDAIEDIKDEIKEAPPDEAAVQKALQDMLEPDINYATACKVLRRYLNRPFT